MKLPAVIVLLVWVHVSSLQVLLEDEDIQITDESVKGLDSGEKDEEDEDQTVESTDKIARVVFLTDLNFTLYTRHNCTSQLDLAADTRLDCFNPSNPTKVLIHGFLARSRTFNKTKNAYLQTGDYNVIVVDWSKPASCWNFKVVAILQRCYVTIVRHYLEAVSRHTAALLQSLERNGANMAQVHLVGHSLGAHVAGRASSIGDMARSLGRITGLDPAGPMFKSAARSKSLDKTDARFVDVIHTNINYFGLSRPIGSADFYPYNGKTQPGCSFPKNIIQKCSHSMSHKYFTESILNPWSFVATPCGVVKEYRGRDSCNGTDVIFMGEHTSTSARGSYYVISSTSSSQSPVIVSYKGTGLFVFALLRGISLSTSGI